ncbi:hypothetical protein [Nonomuraea guangzhouensis]|uniref:Uncharacterized protein n=1 Tax=Nonomuraea guangzhouensis TaxID=1291555 RepID=A0ABW4G8M4_9ACTN|nr:hypothetical protein [Nonomuraea guangzhouensis]
MIIDATNTTLLAYAVTTDPDPLQVSPASGNPSYGGLTIVVSNNTSQAIYCRQIQFTLPIGTLAQDLTNVTTGILTAATPSGNWQLTQTSDGVFTALPTAPQYEEITTDGLVFQIYNIVVNQQVGTFTLTVQETSSLDDSNWQIQTGTFDLAKFPYGFFFGDLAPSAPLVQYHESVDLTWTGSDGPIYTMFAGGHAYDVTDTRTWTSCRLTGDTTFLLQASLQQQGETVTAYQSTTVIVADPSLTATDLTVLTTSTLQGPVTVGTTAQQTSLTVNGTSTLGTTSTGPLTTAGATVTGNLNVNGPSTLNGTTVNGTLNGTNSASLNNLTANGLSALSGTVTLLGQGSVLFAGAGISGGVTFTTDGFLLAQVVPPSDKTKCSFATAAITTGGITFQVQGGTVGSFGSNWSKVMDFNPNVLTVPVQANVKCYFAVTQSSQNQVNSGVQFSWFPIGKGGYRDEPTFRMLTEEELADAPPPPIPPTFSAMPNGDEEASAAFVDRLAEALGAGLPDETRADLALLLRRL